MSIRKIPQNSVNSLVSSAAIWSTTAVVKELMDNAIDALCTDVKVELDQGTGGLKYCMVRDNGVGVLVEDRGLMCFNGTTSKLGEQDGDLVNLAGLSTLGFRGEALFFISQLIQRESINTMNITTRTREDPCALSWNVEKNGTLSSARNLASPVGTSVKMMGLFTAFPVRHKILVSQSAKIINEIRSLIIAYSLTYPALRFSLKLVDINDNGVVSQTAQALKRNVTWCSSNDRTALLAQLCKLRNARKCLAQGYYSSRDTDVFGFKCNYTLPIMSGDSEVSLVKTPYMFLSINRRPINKKASSLFRSISEILRNTYTKFNLLKPMVWFLDIEISDVKDIDVNIEPLKNDVLISKEAIFVDSIELMFIGVVQEIHKVDMTDVTIVNDMNTSKDVTIYKSTSAPLIEKESLKLSIPQYQENLDEVTTNSPKLFVESDSESLLAPDQPFAGESQVQIASDEEDTSDHVTGDHMIRPESSALSSSPRVESRSIAEILTGPKRSQPSITQFVTKRPRRETSPLEELSENTISLDLRVCVPEDTVVSIDNFEPRNDDKLNTEIIEWFEKTAYSLKNGLLVVENDNDLFKLDFT